MKRRGLTVYGKLESRVHSKAPRVAVVSVCRPVHSEFRSPIRV